MKPRTLASIGAVLLYVYCEICQASPFARVEPCPTSKRVIESTARSSDEARDDLVTLFARGTEQIPLLRPASCYWVNSFLRQSSSASRSF